MSLYPNALEPDCYDCDIEPAVALQLKTRPKDVGGFEIRRALPARACRSIGPFVFFDEMGPADLPEGVGMDVRPHPHINLATVTYLFEGAIEHRDSLGTFQVIRPGAINLMVAGRGIVHSERTPQSMRAHSERLHGIQLWIALPEEHEETEPAFFHYIAEHIPVISGPDVEARVLVGEMGEARSPVRTLSPMLFVHVEMSPGSQWAVPDGLSERAVYLVAGKIRCGAESFDEPQMLVFASKARPRIEAEHRSRIVFVAGEPLGQRFMFWNFVSSRRERIEAAKADWREGKFDKVPGDETEFIPLPA